MALSISQIVASSYNAVLTEMRRGANQWAESAFMRELERQNAITRLSLGPVIEATLDWRPAPGAAFLVTDMDTVSLAKTDVLTAATFTPAELSVPIVWSKGDDAKNPTENQKVPLARSLMENGINAHDNLIEQALFATTTNGFLGLKTHVPVSGQGVDGGIDSATETFWRNYTGIWNSGTDIDAALTTAWNAASKGSGASLSPKMLVSGANPHGIFMGQLQAQQRFMDSDEAARGFKVVAFITARYVFSQYGGDEIYLLNPKSFQLIVSRQYFRDRGETQEIPDKNAFVTKIYSALQSVTNNKSRLAVVKKGP